MGHHPCEHEKSTLNQIGYNHLGACTL
uniref:Uncharacterized protein n=1 Tax=Arundo donax TaxID=35708 RepID=A0A0A8Z1S3_ARUDO